MVFYSFWCVFFFSKNLHRIFFEKAVCDNFFYACTKPFQYTECVRYTLNGCRLKLFILQVGKNLNKKKLRKYYSKLHRYPGKVSWVKQETINKHPTGKERCLCLLLYYYRANTENSKYYNILHRLQIRVELC